jgi:hypothetical protein
MGAGQPELLLEILELGEELNNLSGDSADDANLRQVLLDARRLLVLDVVEVHDLILDVEIELATEECAQVLVDEVIERVAGGIPLEMAFEA